MRRTVINLYPAQRTVEGEGFIVNRPFPTPRLADLDPFLLLDELGPLELAPGAAKGAPDHPHRGFETVSYVIAGELEHRDSQGNSGSLRSGDVQWMTAGAGIIHSEMPSRAFQKTGGRLHGFQLWVNLPRSDKRMAPRYQEVSAAQIPSAQSADGRVTVRVLAGSALGATARIDTRTPILYFDCALTAGAEIELPLPADYRVFCYVFEGALSISGSEPIGRGRLAELDSDGDSVVLKTDEAAARLLVIGGVPLGEPVARYGPFVMNTEAEIEEAIADFRAGKLGAIPAHVTRS